MKRCTISGTLTAMVIAAANPASAGVFCGDEIAGGKASGASESEAQSAAISWWSSRAGAVGRGYESWDNAKDKNLACGVAEDGRTECVATARPCLPEGTLPDNMPKLEL